MLDSRSDLHLLIEALQNVGMTPVTNDTGQAPIGFPCVLSLPDGRSIVLDLPYPGLLSLFDPTSIGIAVVDSTGFVRCRWGLSHGVDEASAPDGVLASPIGAIVEDALQGAPGNVFYNGFRYLATTLRHNGTTEALLLICEASEESKTREAASANARSATALKSIGHALSMNHTIQPLAQSAVHAIKSTLDLGAVLLWVRGSADGPMRLAATVGVNTSEMEALEQLDTVDGRGSVAELCASTRQKLVLEDARSSSLTEGLEAQFCHDPPGAIIVLPLIHGDTLIGVLELVGREASGSLERHEDLLETVGEHLTLALNSANLFESIELLAAFDPLMGIANHRTMQEFLNARLTEARREGRQLGVVMIDVDHFRVFNEEEGHDAGDEVLRIVGTVLRDSVRQYDMAARYGGEEFTLILPGSDAASTRNAAERVRKRIEQVEFARTGRDPRRITASLGFATFPEDAEDAASLLKAADDAMYEAKRSGRNCTRMYGELVERHGVASVLASVGGAQAAAGTAFAEDARPIVQVLSSMLELSKDQRSEVYAACLLLPVYLATAEDEREQFASRWSVEASVLDSLEASLERFDGSGRLGLAGEGIPLVGRILNVLAAVLRCDPTANTSDDGRFDPDILAAVIEMQDVA